MLFCSAHLEEVPADGQTTTLSHLYPHALWPSNKTAPPAQCRARSLWSPCSKAGPWPPKRMCGLLIVPQRCSVLLPCDDSLRVSFYRPDYLMPQPHVSTPLLFHNKVTHQMLAGHCTNNLTFRFNVALRGCDFE